MGDPGQSAKSNTPFLIFFGAYTTGSVFLLLLGIGAAFAAYSPRVLDVFQTWGQASDLFGLLARAIALGTRLSGQPIQIGIDYALSFINLAVGIFIIARRPRDWVTRLLSLGMVGTAMAFNFQAHGIVAIIGQSVPPLRPLFVYHFILHAISGATYVHAFLLFPNGTLVPRKLLGLMIVIYILMIEEITFPILKSLFGTSLFLASGARALATNPIQAILLYWLSVNGGGLFVSILHIAFGVQSPVSNFGSIVQAETAFFILLYGVLIPIVGVSSQVYRYRFVSTAEERQQTKIVVWALTCSFTIGLIFFLVALSIETRNLTHIDSATLERLEESAAWIFPPLFAVIPISLMIAIRRSHLFDIDLVINRTLVYVPLTAILAGVFAALTNILQRVFLALTGDQSDAAVIISALVAAAAFTPIRFQLQKIVDERFKHAPPPSSTPRAGDPARQMRGSVHSLMEAAVRSFDAESGAVFWGNDNQLGYTCGEWKGDSCLYAVLENQGVPIGRICLGARRNGSAYTAFDQESLQHAANLLVGAIHLAQN